ncbi:MAG: DUF6485 family protein [Candidatus Omnitrophota bacterium]
MSQKCPNNSINLKNCTCTYGSCSRKGLCCECVRYHLENGEIPGCFFSAEAESRFDRSYSAFSRDLKARG